MKFLILALALSSSLAIADDQSEQWREQFNYNLQQQENRQWELYLQQQADNNARQRQLSDEIDRQNRQRYYPSQYQYDPYINYYRQYDQ